MIKRLLIICPIALFFILAPLFSRAQTFNCYVAHDQLVSPTQYDVDVYLISTSTDFNLRTIQNCIVFNPAFIPAGATVTVTLVSGSSQLNSYSIGPITWSATGFGFQTSSNLGSTCQTGTLITTTVPVRVATFRLESTLPFNCVPSYPNMIIPTDPSPPGLALKMAITKWNSTDCLIGGNTTITSDATFSQYLPNTAYDSVNNMHPVITVQPVSVMNCGAGYVTFSVNTVGNTGISAPIVYQWLENGVAVTNGSTSNGVYSGATTNTLTITSPTVALNGKQYSCIVSQCNADTTVSVLLTISNTNDNDVCTTDFCDPVTGALTHTPLPAINDNNACTNDVCNSISGNITHAAINTNDNNACTTDGCNSLTGVFHTTATISDNNPCTDDVCNTVSGIVTHASVPINDNNACTTDACVSATGAITHTSININDNNFCTVDACDPLTGNISHTPVNASDNNGCTTDGCNSITGVFHTAIYIDDNNSCTFDYCNSLNGTVSHTVLIVDDFDACTVDGCSSITGVFHTPVNFSDNNACTADACNTLTGSITHVVLSNNDNNACTTDGCNSITGVFHTAVVINDNNACTNDACNSSTGSVTHNVINTNDNNVCTTDGCNTITGVYHTSVNSNDNNACTTDACNTSNGTITHVLIATNDNDACSTDGCNSITGVFHTYPNINDNDPCTADACNSITGSITHDIIDINDNNVCTSDGCDPVTGVYHIAPNINDNDPCTADVCNSVTGSVTHDDITPPPPIVTVANNCGYSVLTAGGYTGTLFWSNASTLPSFNVTGQGTFSVTQTVNGCTSPAGSGNAFPKTSPTINLGADVVLAAGSVHQLDAGPGFAGYLWSTGDTTQGISVQTSNSYSVTVTAQNGCTDSDTINVSFVTGIVETFSNKIIHVFPNPAGNSLFLEIDRQEKVLKMEIYNAIGQKQKAEFSSIVAKHILEVNTSFLSEGIYSIVVFTDKGIRTNLFVKE